MAKVAGSYPSLVGGVSQLPASRRQMSQMEVQDNLIPDPVRGLVRRPGTEVLADYKLSATKYEATLADRANDRALFFTQDRQQYLLAYRGSPRVAGAAGAGVVCYNKSANTFLPVVAQAGDDLVEGGGYSAAVQAGRLLLLAVRDMVPTYTVTPAYDNSKAEGRAVVWCRAGNYSRQYSVTVGCYRVDDPSIKFSTTVTYTTPSATYGGLLDTTAILATDPGYTKKVNDLTHAHNQAVAQWVISAATAIQPKVIIQELVTALNLTNRVAAQALDSTLHIGGTVVDAGFTWRLESLSVADDGDGTTLVATSSVVTGVELLPPFATAGHIVKVVPGDGLAHWYMKAEASDESYVSTVTSGAKPVLRVRWVEAAGEVVTAQRVMNFACVEAGTLYIASSPAILTTISGVAFPDIAASVCSDTSVLSVPEMFNNPITCMFMLQDRLFIGAGGALTGSRTGDYLNFFPESLLNTVDTDPVSLSARSSSTDTLYHAVPFERSMLIFGAEATYVIPGNTPITPTSLSLLIQSRYEDLAPCAPAAIGNSLYFGQTKYGKSTIQQMVTGNYEQALQAYPITPELPSYFAGEVSQLVGYASPGTLLVRTTGLSNGLYMYRFLDSRDGRAQSAWSRLLWDEAMGTLMAVTTVAEGLLLLFCRHGVDGTYVVAELLPLDSQQDTLLYMDSQRAYGTGVDALAASPTLAVAVRATAPKYQRHSAVYTAAAAFLAARSELVPATDCVVGYPHTSEVVLTNPQVRDGNDLTIQQGELVVTTMHLTCPSTGGVLYSAQWLPGAAYVPQETFRAERVGSGAPGVIAVGDIFPVLHVAAEASDFRVKLSSIGILPMQISQIEWEGQLFSYRR